ncbi:MAG: hypothetical protein EPN91_04070 [Salinibacterium sp.]|nr:MAG: hypothetical protein EPN91_04070 [Salinibacterium sp.]
MAHLDEFDLAALKARGVPRAQRRKMQRESFAVAQKALTERARRRNQRRARRAALQNNYSWA